MIQQSFSAFKTDARTLLLGQKYQKVTAALFLIAAIEILISGALYAYSIPAIRETIVLATTVQPERFTELYFENHLDLPKDALPNKPYTFSFTVHNLEYRETTYNYESYLEIDNKKVDIDHGSFTLKHDGYKTLKQDYSLIRKLPRTKVIVNLKNKNNQQIHFWVGAASSEASPLGGRGENK